jgi:hypothetical protein
VHSPHFDRLAGVRRNRRWRNTSMAAAIASFFFLVILSVDPLVSDTPPKLGFIVIFAVLLVIFASIATYFHLRFLTRE